MKFPLWLLATVFVATMCISVRLNAQDAIAYSEKKQQAFDLYKQNKFIEAVPLLEQLTTMNSQDRDVFSTLGFCLYSMIKITPDEQKRKDLADRSRKALTRAKELGDRTALTQTLLAKLAEGTPGMNKFSSNSEADQAMQDAEALFVKGDLEPAVELYKKALNADPTLYDAALYIGDSYYKIPGKIDQAGEWFAKAIAINPDRETAYRYWADVLMKQGNLDEAREKYVEAYISEPFNRLTLSTFVNWGKSQHLTLSHPAIQIPTTVQTNDKGNTTITLDDSTLKKGRKDDGSSAWIVYGLSRSLWAGKKFSEEYPKEKTYRHSLKEEAEALRTTISAVKEEVRKSKDLDPSLRTLIRLDEDGVLEPYILLARSDAGIAQDYPAYLKEHRDSLRRYALNWVIKDDHSKK
ncbi:MAG TPA: tetratricopeptide repeat protein [Candidatus Angelobacter sp.]